jgi:hypothetical protein
MKTVGLKGTWSVKIRFRIMQDENTKALEWRASGVGNKNTLQENYRV